MRQFIKLRSRVWQFLILILIFLSVYVYYYTTTSEIRQFTILPNGSQSPGTVARSISETSGNLDAQSVPSKNTTLDPLSPYGSHNTSGYPPVTTIPTSVSSQSPLSNVSAKSSDQAMVKLPSKVQNVSENNTVVIKNESAAAFYEAGHSIPMTEKCPDLGTHLELVILVMSAPSHVEARTAIRQTWGHFDQRKDVSVAFLLGRTNDEKMSKILSLEQDMYRDVIRGNFIDSYSNLTLKTISALEWVRDYCPKVKFVLKTDDDMFINVPRLLSFVNKRSKDRNIIFGRLARKWKPIRNKKSKYYVSQAQFKPEVFPDFTTGPAYLLSGDIVEKLYNGSLVQTYLKLEDVFTTGIVAHKLGIRRTQANEFLNKRISFNPCNIQRSISIHMVKYSEQFDLWKKLLDGKSKCK